MASRTSRRHRPIHATRNEWISGPVARLPAERGIAVGKRKKGTGKMGSSTYFPFFELQKRKIGRRPHFSCPLFLLPRPAGLTRSGGNHRGLGNRDHCT